MSLVCCAVTGSVGGQVSKEGCTIFYTSGICRDGSSSFGGLSLKQLLLAVNVSVTS